MAAITNDASTNASKYSEAEYPSRTVVRAPFQAQIRHNPHPHLVRNTFGFLGLPTAFVETSDYEPKVRWDIKDFVQDSMQRGQWNYKKKFAKKTRDIDEVFALQYFTGLRNFSFKENYVPYLGHKEYYDEWRGQLRKLTEQLYSLRTEPPKSNKPKSPQTSYSNDKPEVLIEQTDSNSSMARLYTSSGRVKTSKCSTPSTANRKSRKSVTRPLTSSEILSKTNKIDLNEIDASIFMILGQLLQTNDPNAVQKWLSEASEREKSTMTSLVEAAIKNEPFQETDEKFHEKGTQTSVYSPSTEQSKKSSLTTNTLTIDHEPTNDKPLESVKSIQENKAKETTRPETSSTFKSDKKSTKSSDKNDENCEKMWKPEVSLG